MIITSLSVLAAFIVHVSCCFAQSNLIHNLDMKAPLTDNIHIHFYEHNVATQDNNADPEGAVFPRDRYRKVPKGTKRPSEIIKCPPGIDDDNEGRLVMQIIENEYYRWREYDIDYSRYCLVMEEPFNKHLSQEEAEHLVKRSRKWFNNHRHAFAYPEDTLYNSSQIDYCVDKTTKRAVFGDDQRWRVISNDLYPFHTMSHISRLSSRGTAFLIGPKVALTSGHFLYKEDTGYIGIPSFALAQTQDIETDALIRPYGTDFPVHWEVRPEYIDDRRVENDLGVLFFVDSYEHEFPDGGQGVYTYMPIEFDSQPDEVEMFGYPGEVHEYTDDNPAFALYGHVGSAQVIGDEGRVIAASYDSSDGQSGGPIFIDIVDENGEYVDTRVVGVHAGYLPLADLNGGPRFVSETDSDLIQSWMQFDAGNLFDLSPDDVAFQDTETGSCSEIMQITLTNNTAANFFELGVSMRSGTDFSLLSSNTINLFANGSSAISIIFCPISPSSKEDYLDIITNRGDILLSAYLSGTGLEEETSPEAPHIVIQPTSMHFGALEPSNCNNDEFTLTNTGGSTATGNIAIMGDADDEFFVSEGGGSFSLDPGEEMTIEVTYCASLPEGPKTATLFVQGTGTTNSVSASLSGFCEEGVSPVQLSWHPGEYDFDEVWVNHCSSLKTFVLSNDGGDSFSGTISLYHDDHFEITSGGGEFNLNPGASRNVRVRFCPVSAGHKQDFLDVLDSDNELVAESILLGHGIHRPSLSVDPNVLDFEEVPVGDCPVLSYQLNGSNLKGVVQLTAPQGFELSTNPNTGFSGSLTISHSGGSIDQAIYVRFCPIEAIPYEGTIVHESEDAIPVNVSVQGVGITVLAVEPASIDFGPVRIEEHKTEVYLLTGLGLTDDVHITAPTDFFLSLSADGPFATSLTLPPGTGTIEQNIYLRFSPEQVKIYEEQVAHETTGAETEYLLINAIGKPNTPVVTTLTGVEITDYTVNIGGEVLRDRGAEVTQSGLVMSKTSIWPTLASNDGYTMDGVAGVGVFTSHINLCALDAGFFYNVRAYAVNSVGEAYASESIMLMAPLTLPELCAYRYLGDESIGDGVEECFDAAYTITLAGNGTEFVVLNGGSVTLIAGESIHFLDGVRVEAGGHLIARIATEEQGFCGSMERSELAAEMDESPWLPLSVSAAEQARDNDLFSVYPNPTTGDFTLELKWIDASEDIKVEIHAARGELIQSLRLPPQPLHSLSLGNHPPGVYIVRVSHGGRDGVERLIRR